MRISDWSSDVCSSDLRAIELPGKAPEPITENMKNPQRQMSADHEKQAHDQSLNTFRRSCSPCTSEQSLFWPVSREVLRSPRTTANTRYEGSSRPAPLLTPHGPPPPSRPRPRPRPTQRRGRTSI